MVQPTTLPNKAFWEAVTLVGILLGVLIASGLYLGGYLSSSGKEKDKADKKEKKDKEDKKAEKEEKAKKDRKKKDEGSDPEQSDEEKKKRRDLDDDRGPDGGDPGGDGGGDGGERDRSGPHMNMTEFELPDGNFIEIPIPSDQAHEINIDVHTPNTPSTAGMSPFHFGPGGGGGDGGGGGGSGAGVTIPAGSQDQFGTFVPVSAAPGQTSFAVPEWIPVGAPTGQIVSVDGRPESIVVPEGFVPLSAIPLEVDGRAVPGRVGADGQPIPVDQTIPVPPLSPEHLVINPVMVDEEIDPLELLNERKVKETVDLGEKQGATEKTGEKATSKVKIPKDAPVEIGDVSAEKLKTKEKKVRVDEKAPLSPILPVDQKAKSKKDNRTEVDPEPGKAKVKKEKEKVRVENEVDVEAEDVKNPRKAKVKTPKEVDPEPETAKVKTKKKVKVSADADSEEEKVVPKDGVKKKKKKGRVAGEADSDSEEVGVGKDGMKTKKKVKGDAEPDKAKVKSKKKVRVEGDADGEESDVSVDDEGRVKKKKNKVDADEKKAKSKTSGKEKVNDDLEDRLQALEDEREKVRTGKTSKKQKVRNGVRVDDEDEEGLASSKNPNRKLKKLRPETDDRAQASNPQVRQKQRGAADVGGYDAQDDIIYDTGGQKVKQQKQRLQQPMPQNAGYQQSQQQPFQQYGQFQQQQQGVYQGMDNMAQAQSQQDSQFPQPPLSRKQKAAQQLQNMQPEKARANKTAGLAEVDAEEQIAEPVEDDQIGAEKVVGQKDVKKSTKHLNPFHKEAHGIEAPDPVIKKKKQIAIVDGDIDEVESGSQIPGEAQVKQRDQEADLTGGSGPAERSVEVPGQKEKLEAQVVASGLSDDEDDEIKRIRELGLDEEIPVMRDAPPREVRERPVPEKIRLKREQRRLAQEAEAAAQGVLADADSTDQDVAEKDQVVIEPPAEEAERAVPQPQGMTGVQLRELDDLERVRARQQELNDSELVGDERKEVEPASPQPQGMTGDQLRELDDLERAQAMQDAEYDPRLVGLEPGEYTRFKRTGKIKPDGPEETESRTGAPSGQSLREQDDAERNAARKAELENPELVGMSKEEHEAFLSSGKGKAKGKSSSSKAGQDPLNLKVVEGDADGDALTEEDNMQRVLARQNELNDPSLVGMTKEEHAEFLRAQKGQKGQSKAKSSKFGGNNIDLRVTPETADGEALTNMDNNERDAARKEEEKRASLVGMSPNEHAEFLKANKNAGKSKSGKSRPDNIELQVVPDPVDGQTLQELDNEQKTDARKRELEDASLVGMSPREHAAFLASESGKAGKSGKEGKSGKNKTSLADLGLDDNVYNVPVDQAATEVYNVQLDDIDTEPQPELRRADAEKPSVRSRKVTADPDPAQDSENDTDGLDYAQQAKSSQSAWEDETPEPKAKSDYLDAAGNLQAQWADEQAQGKSKKTVQVDDSEPESEPTRKPLDQDTDDARTRDEADLPGQTGTAQKPQGQEKVADPARWSGDTFTSETEQNANRDQLSEPVVDNSKETGPRGRRQPREDTLDDGTDLNSTSDRAPREKSGKTPPSPDLGDTPPQPMFVARHGERKNGQKVAGDSDEEEVVATQSDSDTLNGDTKSPDPLTDDDPASVKAKKKAEAKEKKKEEKRARKRAERKDTAQDNTADDSAATADAKASQGDPDQKVRPTGGDDPVGKNSRKDSQRDPDNSQRAPTKGKVRESDPPEYSSRTGSDDGTAKREGSGRSGTSSQAVGDGSLGFWRTLRQTGRVFYHAPIFSILALGSVILAVEGSRQIGALTIMAANPSMVAEPVAKRGLGPDVEATTSVAKNFLKSTSMDPAGLVFILALFQAVCILLIGLFMNAAISRSKRGPVDNSDAWWKNPFNTTGRAVGVLFSTIEVLLMGSKMAHPWSILKRAGWRTYLRLSLLCLQFVLTILLLRQVMSLAFIVATGSKTPFEDTPDITATLDILQSAAESISPGTAMLAVTGVLSVSILNMAWAWFAFWNPRSSSTQSSTESKPRSPKTILILQFCASLTITGLFLGLMFFFGDIVRYANSSQLSNPQGTTNIIGAFAVMTIFIPALGWCALVYWDTVRLVLSSLGCMSAKREIVDEERGRALRRSDDEEIIKTRKARGEY